MIIFKSPLRVSFTGGGSDIEHFYKHHDGHVVSMAINKYVYICVNHHFENKLKVSYSEIENISEVKFLKHELIKKILNYFSIKKGIEISSIADVPSNGSGLGGSSAFTCCLVQALQFFLYNEVLKKKNLSKIGYNIEKGKDSLNAGKQDHIATAFGGLNHIVFKKNDTVKINKININSSFKKKLEDRLFLVHTGLNHNTKNNLKNQFKYRKKTNFKLLIELVNLSKILSKNFKNNSLDNLADILNQSWMIKKKLSDDVSNFYIDRLYEDLIDIGVSGCKLLGSGGGGFILCYTEKKNKKDIIKKLKNKKIINFQIEESGTSLYNLTP
jgi:D-glycero-alpha-D-manno-heptose-7-phosphate kinase